MSIVNVTESQTVRRVRRLKTVLVMVGLLVFQPANSVAAQQSKSLTRFTFTEYHMGVDTRIVVYASTKTIAEDACAAAFNRIADLDSMMSDYRRNSELMKLSDKGSAPQRVFPELFKVLKRSQEVSKLSGGLFDVTVGPLVQLWRKARKTSVLPRPGELAAARRSVGWQKLVLDDQGQAVQLTVPGMRLDLGAIAKGYADDEAQIVLKAHGIRSALIEMGGDIVVTDPPPGTKGWKIRVPNAGDDRGPADKLFSNCAVSSSGDTEQFVIIGGVRYSHVVNPLTGLALTQRVESTVIAQDGLTADPVSTAITLVPKAGRDRLLKAFPKLTGYVRVLSTRASD